jgi:hypothetical protein
MHLMVTLDDGGIRPVVTSIDCGNRMISAKSLANSLASKGEFITIQDKEGKPHIFKKSKLISIQPAPESAK